jgi:ssDNA-binding Zn-finger/Zn-ribbon topoisomerase 1
LDGQPDFDSKGGGTARDLTDVDCPACGGKLRHLVNDGSSGGESWNYWKCPNPECGSSFDDRDGAPDEASRRIAIESAHVCPNCGGAMRRHIRPAALDGTGGWDFWACANRSCRARFPDRDGAPDVDRPAGGQTDVPCPRCGTNLRHLVREGAPSESYNYWKCPSDECGSSYEDRDGAPDPATRKTSVVTDRRCPVCGSNLRHVTREESGGQRGYDLWSCTRRDCRTFLNDKDGEPDYESARAPAGPSGVGCPECGAELVHMQRDASPGRDGYNYWKCPDAGCGASFEDADGKPDPASVRKSILTSRKCPKCGAQILHKTRSSGPEGRGWNYWNCSNSSCNAAWEDQNGAPGPERAKTTATLTEFKCEVCGKPLKHIVKDGENGYNFWGCSGFPVCKTTYQDAGGRPGPKQPPRNEPSGFKCVRCGSDLYRRKGTSARTGADYDFFSCSNQRCRAIFNVRDDKPDVPEAVLKRLADAVKADPAKSSGKEPPRP